MNSVQSDGIGGCRLTSSFCNYKMLTIFFHRIHYIWSSCSCTWIKTWTKSAQSKESHKYTTKKQTVAATMLATQNPPKNSAMYIPVWGYSFFLELGSGGYGQGYMFWEWGGPGTRQEPSVWPEFPVLPHLRLLPGIKIRKNLMFQMALIEFQRRGGTLHLRYLLCWGRNSSESKMPSTCTGKILVPVLYITLTTHMQQLNISIGTVFQDFLHATAFTHWETRFGSSPYQHPTKCWD
jgi:hypothetical protein